MLMQSATTAALNLRQSQNLAISKPRAVYSIDQILGTQNHRRNNNNNANINHNNNNGKRPTKLIHQSFFRRLLESTVFILLSWGGRGDHTGGCSDRMHEEDEDDGGY